jgi:hypothetical protein
MSLPPIAFFSIYEIAVRWNCHPADVAGWAAAGHFQIVAGIPPVTSGDEKVAGLVEVPIADLMSLFRRFGPSEESCRLRRVLIPGRTDWLEVTNPVEGVLIRSSDLLLAAASIQRWEEERDLLRRPSSNVGSTPRYDWDAMYAWLTWFIYEKGVPDTQTELVTLVQDWFVQNSRSGEVPDESTIRKRLTALWRKLKNEEPA